MPNTIYQSDQELKHKQQLSLAETEYLCEGTGSVAVTVSDSDCHCVSDSHTVTVSAGEVR